MTRLDAALQPPGSIRPLWLEGLLPDEAAHPPLESSTSTDVCIVGGGFTGLWTALALKGRSPETDVVLIDGDVCGGGASGRNGGFVMTWWSKFPSLAKLCGPEAAVALCRRSEEAVSEIGRFCEEHGIEAWFRKEGWLWTATSTAQLDAWDTTLGALERAGVQPYERLERAEVAELSGSSVHLAGVREASVATIQPALLVRGLAQVAQSAGVRIHERTPMTALVRDRSPQVVTPHGVVTARTVVIALNAWAAQLPEVAKSLVVVASDVIATEPLGEQGDGLSWPLGLAISDSRRLVHYYRRTDDDRVAFGKGGGALALGGRIGASFHGPSPRVDDVRDQFRRTYPRLADVGIASSWRGPIDYSISGLPFFCRLEESPGVVVCAGFSGNGVGPAKVAGDLLAEMALDGGHAGLPLALTRLPSSRLPPEPFRYAGGRLVRAAVARKERLEDSGRRPDVVTRTVASLDPTSFIDRGQTRP